MEGDQKALVHQVHRELDNEHLEVLEELVCHIRKHEESHKKKFGARWSPSRAPTWRKQQHFFCRREVSDVLSTKSK